MLPLASKERERLDGPSAEKRYALVADRLSPFVAVSAAVFAPPDKPAAPVKVEAVGRLNCVELFAPSPSACKLASALAAEAKPVAMDGRVSVDCTV